MLALAISSEEDDARIYRSFAERLRADFPASASVFDGMAAEEDGHRQRLIDLHRAQIREHTPRRWRVKDLAGLYFSAMDCGLTRRDLLRFIRHYGAGRPRQASDQRLWRQVERQATGLYRKAHGREPPALRARVQ